MAGEKIFRARAKLRKVAKVDLLRMAFSQKEKNCVLGGACPFLLEYQRILFCVSEILGQGCQMEKLRSLSDQDIQSEGESPQKAMEPSVGPWLPGFG